MIGDSSLFKKLVNSYVPQEARVEILNTVTKYERSIRERVPLEKISPVEYNRCLNESINMIEKSVYIMSWMNQMKHNVKLKKDAKDKEYTLRKISISKQIDTLDVLKDFTSKTEKQKAKQLLMEEQLVEVEYELEELKTDLSISEIYTKDAEELNKLVYAYYQAIKNMQTLGG